MEKYFSGSKLQELRKSRGLTSQELASKMGYSQSYISRFENNKAIPDVNTLIKMLNILDTDIATFFSSNLSSQQYQVIQAASNLSSYQASKLIDFLNSLGANNE